MKRRHSSSGLDFEEKIGYSRAVVDGDYVFVSVPLVITTRLCLFPATWLSKLSNA